jgi:hypothetical protein
MPPAQEDKSVPAVLSELKDLTIEYAKQETVEPLKGLGRFVGFGVGGALLLGLGACLWGIAVLRFLQTETGELFTGNLQVVPYLVTVAFLGIVAGVALQQVRKGEKRHEETKK